MTEKEKAITQFRKVFEGLKKYENEDKKLINLLSLDLKRLEKIVYNQKRIYIPFIGPSSAGKSTILNCIAGYYIFPESEKECTTRGIIIKHSFDGNTSLFETDVDLSLDYYIFKERCSDPVAIGKSNVTEYLKYLNTAISKDQKKHFYILRTPLLLFDILQLSDELKERISFIDLPGGDTDENIMKQLSYQNDTTICQKLISISSSFCFVNRGTALKVNPNNSILSSLFHKSRRNSQIIDPNDFLQNCLFIINDFGDLKDEDKDILTIKSDIGKIIINQSNEKENNNINVEIFNAKKYLTYLQIRNTYMNIEDLFDSLFLQFNSQNIFRRFFKELNFIKFCYDKIKNKLKDISLEIDEKKNCDDERFSEKITSLISNYLNSINKTIETRDKMTLKKIINVLFDFRKRIKNIRFYSESNCENFFHQIHQQIINSDKLLERKYNEYLDDSFKYLDKFFYQDFKKKIYKD